MADTTPIRYSGAQFQSPMSVRDTDGTVVLNLGGAGAAGVGSAAGALGFFGGAGATIQTVPLTTPDAQDIIDALVAYGLVVQSD